MTGELTLRGRVLPVGGVKEKILAAYRIGFHTVVLPRRNKKDLDELPQEVRENMNLILVENLAQVFSACFKEEAVRKAA